MMYMTVFAVAFHLIYASRISNLIDFNIIYNSNNNKKFANPLGDAAL
jgi:hypothetical protein